MVEMLITEKGLLIEYVHRGIPADLQSYFGELNWLGPCLPSVVFGYEGNVYKCTTFKRRQEFFTEVNLIIKDFIEDALIGGTQMKSCGNEEGCYDGLKRSAANFIIEKSLKEHKEIYYK